MNTNVTGREITAIRSDSTPQRWLSGALETHPCADREPVRRWLPHAEGQPVIRRRALIQQEAGGAAIGRVHDVNGRIMAEQERDV